MRQTLKNKEKTKKCHCYVNVNSMTLYYYPVSPKIADVLVRQPSFWHSQQTQTYAKLDLTRYYFAVLLDSTSQMGTDLRLRNLSDLLGMALPPSPNPRVPITPGIDAFPSGGTIPLLPVRRESSRKIGVDIWQSGISHHQRRQT